MKYHINPEDQRPAYMQLYAMLRSDIAGGVYAWGAKLPSKRLLAEECGVSVITVEHAFAILCDEGYIRSQQRSGYYVLYRAGDFVSMPEHVPTVHRDVCPSGETAGFPFSVLSRTMRRVLLDYGEQILVKPPNRGCDELREAIAAYLVRSAGITARPEQIVIGSGAEYLYGLIVQMLGKERVFALENPSYEKIRRVYQANGVRCDLLPMGTDGIRSEALEVSAATVLHITPFNSYPSGVTASASKRAEYIRWAERRRGYIVEDNFDSELTVSTKAEDTVFAQAPEGCVIYVNTFSRTIAPSIRAGYMVLPDALLEVFEQRLGFYSCTVPVFEQYVLAMLLDSGDFERHINRVRRMRRKQREK